MGTMIYTNQKSKVKRKMTAKRRAEQESWEALLKKYEPKTETKGKPFKAPAPYRRETATIPSLHTTNADCSKRQAPIYTGTAILGIATMHKSNAVPVFSQEDAEDISRMRR